MPFANHHSARLQDPALFDPDAYHTTHGGELYNRLKVPESIDIIWGKFRGKATADDPIIAQSLRFDRTQWTVEAAKKWLAEKDVHYTEFVPATGGANAEGDAGIPTDSTITVLASGDGGTVRVAGMAYTGGKMRLPRWPLPVVVDLAGLRIPESVPLLVNHANETGSRIGMVHVYVRGQTLELEGEIIPGTEDAEQVLRHARLRPPWQLSIGAEPADVELVRDRRIVNGQAQDGPFYHVKRAVLREISVLPCGADAETHLAIAATFTFAGDWNMEAEKEVEGRELAESQRIAMVHSLCVEHPALEAEAIRAGWDVDQVREAVLEALRGARPTVTAMRGRKVHEARAVLACAAMLHAGLSDVAERAYGADLMQMAEEARVNSLFSLCERLLAAEGIQPPSGRHDLIRAAFSTASLPNLLGDAAGKILLDAYNEAPATWQSFAKIVDVQDFHAHPALRPTFLGNMEEVEPGGELRHTVLSEQALSEVKIATFGKVLRVTRQDVINDDTGFLSEVAGAYGKQARRGLNDLVWGVIMANAGTPAFFSTDHANLLGNGTSALQASSLAAAVTLLRCQRDENQADLDIKPAVLVVPPELEMVARGILESAEVQAAESLPLGNALKGIAKLEVESRASNLTKFAGASATGWYLFASPQDAPVIVAFLRGNRTPTVETFGLDAEPGTLGLSWRTFFDYGAVLNDWRAAVRSDGK